MIPPAQEPEVGSSVRWPDDAHIAVLCTPQRARDEQVGRWLAGALGRGRQVLYKHDDAPALAQRWLSTLVGEDVLDSGQVQLVDPARCHTDTGGRPDALRAWHLARIEQARHGGHSGVAIVCDGAALSTIAPDPEARTDHERDLSRLGATAPISVLCRYDTSVEAPAALPELVGVHTAFDDVGFGARREPDRLVVSGEVDAGNADLFAGVLAAAIAEGARTVDVGELRFCSAAGLRALHDALPPLRAAGETLTLHRPHSVLRQMLGITGLSGDGIVMTA